MRYSARGFAAPGKKLASKAQRLHVAIASAVSIGTSEAAPAPVDIRGVHFWAVRIDREANAILLQRSYDPAALAQIPYHAVLHV